MPSITAYALTLLLFLVAISLHVLIMKTPDKEEHPILAAARRLKVGAYLIAVLPTGFHIFMADKLNLYFSAPHYLIISLVLLTMADVFISVARFFGLIEVNTSMTFHRNLFPVTKTNFEETPYVPISRTDRQPD